MPRLRGADVLVESLLNEGMTTVSGIPVLVEVPNRFSHPGYGSFARWD